MPGGISVWIYNHMRKICLNSLEGSLLVWTLNPYPNQALSLLCALKVLTSHQCKWPLTYVSPARGKVFYLWSFLGPGSFTEIWVFRPYIVGAELSWLLCDPTQSFLIETKADRIYLAKPFEFLRRKVLHRQKVIVLTVALLIIFQGWVNVKWFSRYLASAVSLFSFIFTTCP